jgi:hypothetical protein
MYDARSTLKSNSFDARRTRRRETALVAQYIHQLSERPAGSRHLSAAPPTGQPRPVSSPGNSVKDR